jgi:hypothetical protein
MRFARAASKVFRGVIPMKSVFGVAVLLAATITTPLGPAQAHNVWCHCAFPDARDTIEFFHKAGAVYETLSKKVLLKWHQANSPLEEGVLAEFEHKVDRSKGLKANLFRQTLVGLTELRTNLDDLDVKLADVESFVSSKKVTPVFDTTVARLLREDRPIERLSATGVRYSEVSGITSKDGVIEGIAGILAAQRADLRILTNKLDEVIAGLRDAIPLAEKGEFAAVMLSGRNVFGDKMPQFTDMISAYERLYVRTCMATIAATMQIFPRGFEWVR